MGASAGHVNLERHALALVRSPSTSLFCESDDSDFEFDLSEISSDEPPASPKLQLTLSPQWGSAASGMAMPPHITEDHIYTAAPNIHHLHVMDMVLQDGGVAEYSDTIKSPHKYRNYDGNMNHQIRSRGGIGSLEVDELSTAVMSTSTDQGPKRRSNLRSLMLERGEFEQLPSLVGIHRSNVGITNGDQMNLRDWSCSSSSDASSPDSPASVSCASASSSPQHHTKASSRRWSFNLDFFHTKKVALTGPLKAVDYDPAAAMHDRHHDVAEIRDGNVESPRRSTCSLSSISSGTSSFPVSPVAFPSRAAPSIPPGPRSPMSPHAQHYQRQRARAEELRRRTFLPYRQSLLGACFFPSAPSPSPQVAV
ncbi:hypothetical protein GOP47_0028875 [Adiantum capillus-veneris]|nr:hypothetical protein GOP47_0028875 [Adiantum capillus-veneris]